MQLTGDVATASKDADDQMLASEPLFDIIWEPPRETNGVPSQPDVTLVGTDKKAVRAHSAALRLATEIFDAILTLDEDPGVSQILNDGSTAIDMQETSSTLALVIPFCYNLPNLGITEPYLTLLAAYRAAHKFVCTRAIECLGRELLSRLVSNRNCGDKADSHTVARQHALDLLALATQLKDKAVVEISKRYAVIQFDLQRPLRHVEVIGQNEMMTLIGRKRRMKDRLNAVIATAMEFEDDWTEWDCHSQQQHGRVVQKWLKHCCAILRQHGSATRNFTFIQGYEFDFEDGFEPYIHTDDASSLDDGDDDYDDDHHDDDDDEDEKPLCRLSLEQQARQLRENWNTVLQQCPPY